MTGRSQSPSVFTTKAAAGSIETCPYGVFKEVRRFEFAGLSHPWSGMDGKCYYNSVPCGGTCIQTCPAGTGDRQMKKAVAKRCAPAATGSGDKRRSRKQVLTNRSSGRRKRRR